MNVHRYSELEGYYDFVFKNLSKIRAKLNPSLPGLTIMLNFVLHGFHAAFNFFLGPCCHLKFLIMIEESGSKHSFFLFWYSHCGEEKKQFDMKTTHGKEM
jgi:hypothetical protein